MDPGNKLQIQIRVKKTFLISLVVFQKKENSTSCNFIAVLNAKNTNKIKVNMQRTFQTCKQQVSVGLLSLNGLLQAVYGLQAVLGALPLNIFKHKTLSIALKPSRPRLFLPIKPVEHDVR